MKFQGIKPNSAKIETITHIKLPININKLRRFLEMTNYYRRFIQNYAQIADLLTKLLRKNAIYKWNPACQKAFDILKDKFRFHQYWHI
jgi:hypothetical protein